MNQEQEPYPVDPHRWGEWVETRVPYRRIISLSLVAIMFVGSGYLHYRAASRKATLQNIISKRPATEATKKSKPEGTESAYNSVSPLSREAQSKMDAFLVKATNLSRSSRDVRPMDFPGISSPGASVTSRSATSAPKEAVPEAVFPAAAIAPSSATELLTDTTALEPNSSVDTAHEIVPIRAISSRRQDGSHAAIGENSPMVREDLPFDAPALRRPPGYQAGSTSGLLRAVPVPATGPTFEEPTGQLKPSRVNSVASVPLTSVPVPVPLTPTLSKPLEGRPAKSATVNLRVGDTVRRFSIRAYEPMQVGGNSPVPFTRRKKYHSAANNLADYVVYQEDPVNCTPWIVQPGQSVESLAAALKILPGEIRDINQVSSVIPGQLIYLPVHNTEIR